MAAVRAAAREAGVPAEHLHSVSYQLSLGDAPDTGQHGDCGSTATITTTAAITTATTG
jgi:hypothetical protein